MWGFGTLTPFAGWAATGLPLDMARGLVLLAFCPLFAALYPLTQLYQLEEDTRRGDRTLACVLGVRRSLDGGDRDGRRSPSPSSPRPGVRAGWRAGGPDLWRWAGLALALAAGPRCCCPGGGAAGALDAGRSPAGHVPGARRLGRHRRRRRAGLGHLTALGRARGGCVYFEHFLTSPGDGMHSAVELRADHDLTDVPAIVRGAVKLGLLESVLVLVDLAGLAPAARTACSRRSCSA